MIHVIVVDDKIDPIGDIAIKLVILPPEYQNTIQAASIVLTEAGLVEHVYPATFVFDNTSSNTSTMLNMVLES